MYVAQPAAIQKHLREHGEILDAPACMKALKQMEKAGEIIAHAGDTPRKSRYTLNPQFVAGAPSNSPPREGKASKKKKPKKSKVAKRPRATPKPAAAPALVAALTVDHALVLVDQGVVTLFTPEQTEVIATLCANNFG